MGDGIVGFLDFSQFVGAYGKCVNESGTVYNRASESGAVYEPR